MKGTSDKLLHIKQISFTRKLNQTHLNYFILIIYGMTFENYKESFFTVGHFSNVGVQIILL